MFAQVAATVCWSALAEVRCLWHGALMGANDGVQTVHASKQVIEILTVGFPYCCFKVIAGVAMAAHSWLLVAGALLIGLAVFDLVVNVSNLVWLLAKRRRLLAICVSQMMLTRSWRAAPHPLNELGAAIDVFLSCALVASMIGFAQLSTLSSFQLKVWNVAVILNVLGAGYGRLSSSLVSLREH